MKLPKADPQTWRDLEAFTDWALDVGMNDERVLALCDLFLELNRLIETQLDTKVMH